MDLHPPHETHRIQHGPELPVPLQRHQVGRPRETHLEDLSGLNGSPPFNKSGCVHDHVAHSDASPPSRSNE